MHNFSLRGLDPDTLAALKARAARENTSVNTLILRLVDLGLGRAPERRPRERYADLDALAGSWTEEDAAEFAELTTAFSEVDPDLWK